MRHPVDYNAEWAETMDGFRRDRTGRISGDVIPAFLDGHYHLFVLAPPPGAIAAAGSTWRHLRTDRLNEWELLPEALAPGDDEDPDVNAIWTGSAIVVAGTTHLFYTGSQPNDRFPQTICHASSTDGVSFVKDPANPILLPTQPTFEPGDWRDPFVFWNSEVGAYWMLVTARVGFGPKSRRGVIALSSSSDLESWGRPEVFYQPWDTYGLECPELFRLGESWWLGFSRFSDRPQTAYRYSESTRGPWKTPSRDAVDGPRWYAAKSLTDADGRRIVFGWVADREQVGEGRGRWLWGGDLSTPRELISRGEGHIGVALAEDAVAFAGRDVLSSVERISGEWVLGANSAHATAVQGAAVGLVHREMSRGLDAYRVDLTLRWEEVNGFIAVLVACGPDLGCGVALEIHPTSGVARLRSLPEDASKFANSEDAVCNQFGPPTRSGSVDVTVIVVGDVFEAFVAGEVALSMRAMAVDHHYISLVVTDGVAEYKNMALKSGRVTTREASTVDA